ncbi:MAG: hypothetical protein RLO50_01385 [Azospirillaceae bacterium]
MALALLTAFTLAACDSSLNPFAEDEAPPVDGQQTTPNIGSPETVIVPPSLDGSGAASPPLGFNVRAFTNFLETRPTPAEFRQVYPEIQLVMPDDIVTADYRVDYRRFFVYLDALGRIEGGEFR